MSDFSNLNSLLEEFVHHGLPGCGLQITQHGQTIYEGYFGYADIENKIPVSASSLFRQASMSKLPLYTVLMMLYEKGKFLLTDPLSDFFPEWKHSTKYLKNPNGYVDIVPTTRPVIISDILSMKCGLPYCNFPGDTTNETLRAMQKRMQPLWDRGHFTLQEQIQVMADVPQAFDPGSHWLYGFSSELAAGLIEKVCDKPIDDVFQMMLFDPLEMSDTRSHYFGNTKERMVTLYGKDENGSLSPIHTVLDDKHLPRKEHECGWARLFSSVNDYSKLMQILACGGTYKGQQIIGRKTIDLMRSNGLTSEQLKDFEDTYNAGYGYGYGVRTLIDKQRGNHNGSLGAFGWTGGFGTWCESDPEEEVSIVYMHNMMPDEELYYHLRMRAAAYGCLD
ncbi:MAG TPA: serine hydrolase domain-containing protein [Lachnospiraceae bacterium]|nr:serine hydrolase domain-containing protein [Lachnospiraceae bacterium]